MKRKSPIKHKVRSYKRKNKVVRSYLRGKGQGTVPNLSKPTLHQKPKGYTVTLKYSDTEKEEIKVIATDYHRAIDEAFEEKMDKRMPVEISVIDPLLGEIIHWAGARALKYGKAVINKSYDFVKGQAISAAKDWETKRLIVEAYSENKGKQILARAKLKRDHPEVWDIMDISRS